MQPSSPQVVDALNYVRAECDTQLSHYATLAGGVGALLHLRQPYPIERQPTTRCNRDTLYSGAVLDLTNPATIMMPEPGDRFQSLLVVTQDHYMPVLHHGAGTVEVSEAMTGTRYALALFRTFADPRIETDLEAAHALQNAIAIHQDAPGQLELPSWDQESLGRIRDQIMTLGSSVSQTLPRAYGPPTNVDPIQHYLGTAFGWAGNPREGSVYFSEAPPQNDGQTPYVLTMPADVPTDAFWSVSLYNHHGFFETNDYEAYTYNSVTAAREPDGSVVIHFGGDPQMSNFLPIMDGWNYLIRCYRPRAEILEGRWSPPSAHRVDG